MATNTGKDFEQLVRGVFELLEQEEGASRVEIKHDVKLRGFKLGTHQIDLYWEFERSGVKHVCIAEAKDWKRPVPKEKMDRFAAIMTDLPDQPRGFFVSRIGYQAGAEEVAKRVGIVLLVLSESEAQPLKLPVNSIVRFEPRTGESFRTRSGGTITKVPVDCVLYEPILNKLKVGLSKAFIENYKVTTGIGSLKDFPIIEDAGSFRTLKFYSSAGEVTGTFLKRVQADLRTLMKNKMDTDHFIHELEPGTFMKPLSSDWPLIEVSNLGYRLSVTTKVLGTIYLREVGQREFVLRNLISGTERRLEIIEKDYARTKNA